MITVVGGEDYAFDAFSLKVIPNLHTASAAPCCKKRFFNGPQAGVTPRGVSADPEALFEAIMVPPAR